MYRSLLLTGGLCLSGCSTLRIGTAEGNSRPVSIGIDDSSREATSPGPGRPAIPSGMTQVTVDPGPHCPIEVQLAMGADWNDDVAYDGYQLYSRDDGAIITVNCNEDSDETGSRTTAGCTR